MKRKIQFGCLFLILALTTACIHKTGGVATPMEKAVTYNAALADADNTVERGAEACALSGVLTSVQVEPIIEWTARVAIIHEQITLTLQQGGMTTANVASITALIDQLKNSVNTIQPQALGVKNPKSQQTFQADVANIFALADAVLNSLQAGGLK